MNFYIQGGSFPVLICDMANGDCMVCQGGGMSWMSPNVKMETTSNGGIGKMLGRMMTKESLFMNRYTAMGGPGLIAFASSLPGEIMQLDVTGGKEYICQKSAFLACTPGVELSTHFQKKLGAGFFGGEGFIMQRLSGNGQAFIEIDGAAMRYTLAPGQQMIVDTGHVVMMSATCQMDVQTVGGIKNTLFGGEGLFNTVVTGPGEVVLQSMPTSKLAGVLKPYIAPTSAG